MRLRTHSARETEGLGRAIARQLRPAWVILLRGPLGSGKTTFVRGLLHELGVRGRVISPSFLLVKTYRVRKRGILRVHHLDGYRLKGRRELEPLGFDELLTDPHAVTVIEWPKFMGNQLRGRRVIELDLKIKKLHERTIVIRGLRRARRSG